MIYSVEVRRTTEGRSHDLIARGTWRPGKTPVLNEKLPKALLDAFGAFPEGPGTHTLRVEEEQYRIAIV